MENESIVRLLKDRYFLKNENSWKDIAKRVSGLYPEIFPLISDKTFIPSTPTLLNANTNGERRGTLSSCFPMGIEDSIEGIFDSLKETAIVTKMGGGVGYDYSNLRGSDEIVKTINRPSSGPIPFMRIKNSTLNGIQQGGVRRGAGMGLLSIYHRDIAKFIDLKKDVANNKDKKDGQNEMERMNLSAKIPNSFYEEVLNNPDNIHKVRNTVGGEECDLVGEDGNKMTVRQLWKQIIHNAWLVAEPGIFNETIAFERCSVTNVSKSVICNPCFSGDTLIAVADGRGSVPIKQLAEENKDVLVYSFNREGKLVVKKFMNPRLTRQNADIFEVEFDSGLKIRCTEDHNLLTTDGKLVMLKDLEIGASIKSAIKHTMRIGEAHPWMKKIASSGQDYLFWETDGKRKADHRIIAEYKMGRDLLRDEVVHHKDHDGQNNNPNNLDVMKNKEHNELHKKDMSGENNSVHKIKDKKAWRKKLSKKHKGVGNGNAKKITNKQICKKIREITKSTFQNYFTLQMWKDHSFPILNSKNGTYRMNNVEEYCRKAGAEYIRSDIYNKIVQINNELETNKYVFVYNKNKKDFDIKKKCEYCGTEFVVGYNKRQITFCSHQCLSRHINKPFMFSDFDFSEKYLNRPDVQRRIKKTFEIVQEYKTNHDKYKNFRKENKTAQSIIRHNNIFSPSLEYVRENMSEISSAEDLIECARKNIPSFKNKNILSEAVGEGYNHKIVKITHVGKEDVYDGTVEDYHNLLVGGRIFQNEFGKQSEEFVAFGQCQEFTNIPYSSCSLASLNLTKFIKHNKFDWISFSEAIRHGTIFLNNVIDINIYPIEKIEKTTLAIRPIGLGAMGLADMLYKLKIPYNSREAFDLVAEMSRFITLKSMECSVELAKKNKKSYDAFDYELFMKANKRFFDKPCRDIDVEKLQKDIKKYGIYNSSFTSFAPTGSISTIAEVSGGIEPVFALLYTRRVEKLDKKYDKIYVVNKLFEQYVNENFPEQKEQIFEEVANSKGSCQKCSLIPDDMKKVFVVAGDLTPMEHLDILEAAANNVSLSVSKTINLPKDAKEEDVEQVFLEAYKRGIIGVTVYRDGCRGEGILMHKEERQTEIEYAPDAPKRPEIVECDIHHVKITKKLDKPRSFEYLVIVGFHPKYPDVPFEVFAVENGILEKKFVKGKTKKCGRGRYNLIAQHGEETKELHNITKDTTELEDLITRQISLELRHRIPIRFVLQQLEKSGDIGSFNKAIMRALKKYEKGHQDHDDFGGLVCPICEEKGQKGEFRREEGCIKCSCGWSKCG